jgi:D-alanyl-D-alanine carboxypeptidase
MRAFCALNQEGHVIASSQANTSLIPASNTKLFSAAAALDQWSPTTIPAPPLQLSIDAHNNLVIEMQGNLFLSARYQTGDLDFLLQKQFTVLTDLIKNSGSKYFNQLKLTCDTQALLPLAHYPCVSFLSLNENTLDLRVDKQLNPCPKHQNGFSLIHSPSTTGQERHAEEIRFNQQENSVDFWRLEKQNWTHSLIVQYLENQGISFDSPQSKNHLDETKIIGSIPDNHTLKELVYSSLCFSDNFRAELIALHLRQSHQWLDLNSSLQDLYQKAHLSNTQLVDGSGLLRENQTSASDLCKLLHFMDHHRARQTWHSSLAIAGQSGTLKNTYANTALDGRFHGKSGTLNEVRSLSGYLSLKNSQTIYLSFLQNEADCSNFKSFALNTVDEILAQYENT